MLKSSLLRKEVISPAKMANFSFYVVGYICKLLHENIWLEHASSFMRVPLLGMKNFSSVVPCAILLCWWLVVLNNFLPFPLLMKWIVIRKLKPSNENPFLVGLGTDVGHRGTANIMLHVLQSIGPFVVYSPECILTSSEALAGKGFFVWLIFSYLWSTRHVFLIIKQKSTHFYFHQVSESPFLRYLAHK